nr:unnamed protein product [Callosobruchus chinensis]
MPFIDLVSILSFAVTLILTPTILTPKMIDSVIFQANLT